MAFRVTQQFTRQFTPSALSRWVELQFASFELYLRSIWDSNMFALSAKLSANYPLAGATWATPPGWAINKIRPFNSSSFSSGVFTAPKSSWYFFVVSFCFNPDTGDSIKVRLATSGVSGGGGVNYVLAGLDIPTNGSSELSLGNTTISGSVLVYLNVAETATIQVYSSNPSGDAIQATSGDGVMSFISISEQGI